MKKLVLAAAIAAVASNAMAFEIYNADGTTVDLFGEIRTRLQSKENDGAGTQFDMGSSKLGVKAQHVINEDLTATGYIRYSFDANGSDSVSVSKGWVGLASDQFGEVSIGNQGTIHDDLMWIHDHTFVFGGNAVNSVDAFGTGVNGGLVKYSWSNDSLTLKAQYQAAAAKGQGFMNQVDRTGRSEKEINSTIDKGYALGAEWASDFGLTLVGAYTSTDIEDVTNAAKTTLFDKGESTTAGIGASYSIQGLTLALGTTQIEVEADNATFDMDLDGLGASVKYVFNNGVNVYGVYDLREADFKHNSAQQDTTTYTIGASYKPHARVKTFVEFADESVDTKTSTTPSSTADTNKWAVGARVYF